MTRINKKQLAKKIAKQGNYYIVHVLGVLDALEKVMADEILKGNHVFIRGVGDFVGCKKRDVPVHNPNTGEKIRTEDMYWVRGHGSLSLTRRYDFLKKQQNKK